MIKVALFPIPNSVNFPGLPCSIHVFEPRYRQMVRYCLEQKILLAVCNTQKVIHAVEEQQDLEQVLSTNQATYKPCEIFSAGPVTLQEELDDGRLLIEIDTNIRLRLQRKHQVLPFIIGECEPWDDKLLSDGEMQLLEQNKMKILQRLIALTHDNQEYQQILKGEYWQTMPSLQFSFSIMGMFGIEADIKQHLLEVTDPNARLQQLLAMINET